MSERNRTDLSTEFFLHHEGNVLCLFQKQSFDASCLEKYHNTPETQTDESYNHPEDIEHFSHHEKIEKEETERLAKFQGISIEDVLKYQGKPFSEQANNDPQSPMAVRMASCQETGG